MTRWSSVLEALIAALALGAVVYLIARGVLRPPEPHSATMVQAEGSTVWSWEGCYPKIGAPAGNVTEQDMVCVV